MCDLVPAVQPLAEYLQYFTFCGGHLPHAHSCLCDGVIGKEMHEKHQVRPAFVIGLLGERLTIETLPSADTKHWVVRRKAEVLAAVNGGLLGMEEACTRYRLTIEEFAEWQRAIDRAGLPGLRVTKAQQYRQPVESENED